MSFLALGLGSGLAPVAPGTFGTLAAIPFYLLIAQTPLLIQMVIIVASFLVGIYLCGEAARKLGVHDHPAIVWDEFVGYWLTMWVVPLMGAELSLWLVIWGFILFRLFDIVKPWPIRWLDKHIHGGLGIMLDDILAGIFAGVCLGLIILL